MRGCCDINSKWEELDVAAITRHCQGCINTNALESKLSNDEFMKREAEHDCSITHIGSVPAMGTKGTGFLTVPKIRD